MSSNFDFFSLVSQRGATHPNPTFDFLTGFAPRKLKDLFKWVEYLYYNSAHIFAALKKFSEYPVTDFEITGTESSVKSWKGLLEGDIKMRSVSIKTGLDMHLYGNSFISVYKPFNRYLICGNCKGKAGIQHVKYKFKLKALTFHYTCPACHQRTIGTAEDARVADRKRVNIIRWDPKLMDINHNPITNESEYYYTIPGELKTKVKEGDQHIVNTLPMEFLKAIRDDKVFKFGKGQIYHMKIDPPAGIESQWGFPPLTATIKLFFYASILRKANEAIALEHIVPFRVLHPAPISGNADPTQKMDLAKWKNELKKNIAIWRRDPLHVMFAPAALGVTMMGGQGRSLLTLGEVKEAEDNIIAAMGIPREFLYGGLSFTGSAVTLRMLENQLETYTAHLNEQMNWIVEQISGVMGWDKVSVKYVPFKLMDDAQQKMVIAQLYAQLGSISKDTIMNLHDLDLSEERTKLKQEQLDDVRMQMDLEQERQKIMESVAAQAQQAAASGGPSYNVTQVMQEADAITQQLMQMDEGTRRSTMSHLSQEDPVMYAVVKDRMATQNTMQSQQAETLLEQGV